MAGPSSDFKTIDGVTIHYQILGTGRTLLLLHGIGASVYTWRLLLPFLAKTFQVVAVDIPGFGRSSKDPKRDHGLDEQSLIIKKFVDDMGFKNVGLIGSSMGGAIALWMCKVFPTQFKDVAVLAPAVSSQLLPIELARLSSLFWPTASLLINKTLIKSMIKKVISRHDIITDEVVRQYQRPYIEEPKTINTFIRATKIISDSRLPAELASIEARVLIVYGAQDKMIPRAVMKQLHSVLPNAEYVEHESAGHHSMEDEPEWLAEKLSDFFGS